MTRPSRRMLSVAIAPAACVVLWLAVPAGRGVARVAAAAEEPAAKAAGTFEVYKDKAGEHRWRLKAANGQVIATSGDGYKERRDCLAGIESVRRNAPAAKVADEPAAK